MLKRFPFYILYFGGRYYPLRNSGENNHNYGYKAKSNLLYHYVRNSIILYLQIFKHYVTFYNDYGDIIKTTLSKARETNKTNASKTMAQALILKFREVQHFRNSEEVDRDTAEYHWLSLKELAKRWVFIQFLLLYFCTALRSYPSKDLSCECCRVDSICSCRNFSLPKENKGCTIEKSLALKYLQIRAIFRPGCAQEPRSCDSTSSWGYSVLGDSDGKPGWPYWTTAKSPISWNRHWIHQQVT